MSVWGTIAAVASGAGATLATGGNVAAGVAVGTAVNNATSGSTGQCPPRTADVQFLLQNISPSDRQQWLAFNPTTGGRAGGRWNVAIQNDDVNLLAFYVVGEEDCKLASDEQQLVNFFNQLLTKYRRALGQGSTPTYTTTQPTTRSQLGQIADAAVDTASAILQGGLQGAQTAATGARDAATRTTSFDPLWLVAGAAIAFAVYASTR